MINFAPKRSQIEYNRIMKRINYPIPLLLVACLMLQLAACRGGQSSPSAASSGDSIYTKEYMVSIHMQEPERALVIIDTMEARQLAPAYLAHYMRSIVYQNALSQPRLAIYHAMQATADPRFEQEDPNNCCSAYNLISERDYRRGNFKSCLTYLKRGFDLAKRAQIPLQELNFSFAMGRCMLSSGNVEEGMRLLQEVLHQDSLRYAHPHNMLEANHVVYVAGELMETYYNRGMLAEAKALIPHAEYTLELLDGCEQFPEPLRRTRRMEIYSNIMKVYDQLGDFTKSELYMQKMMACESKSVSSLVRAAGHYMVGKRYQKVLSILNEVDPMFQSQFDSISADYLKNVLERQLTAYVALGREHDARITAQRIITIKDSLYTRTQEGDAAQLSKIYETQEKEKLLQEQKQKLSTQRSYLVTSVIFLIVAFTFVGVMIYYNRRINRQSKATVRAIRQLIDPSEKDTNESATQVMEEMQLRQAAHLFRSNPSYEVNEVAAKCGFDDMAVFQRLFIRHFGLNPAEYRKWSLHLKREEERPQEVNQRKTEEENKMKSSFIQNMSHEIRTPLNQISGFVQLLTDPDMTMDENEKRKVNDIIAEQTQHMTLMLNTFLEMSEYESSDDILPTDEVSIDTLLDEVRDATPMPQPGVEVHAVNRSGLSTTAVNAKGLQRLLACLMNNAVKFTSEGSIKLACDQDEAGHLRFSVTDTGKGIPEGEDEKIFENFYKVDEFIPGVGLGLPLAKKIAQRLGASLILDRSYQAKGSRFVVTIG